MKKRISVFPTLLALALLFGCSSGSGNSITRTIGATGGTISLGGMSLAIPAGALAGDQAITISKATATPPSGVSVLGQAYRFQPAGLSFLKNVTITIPYDPIVGVTINIYWSSGDEQTFTALSTECGTSSCTAGVNHFSYGFVGSSSMVQDGGTDAGADSGEPADGGADAGADSGEPADGGTDAGIDAGADAGPSSLIIFKGPGSVWALDMKDTVNFTLTETDLAVSKISISGIYEQLENEFMKFTVQEASGEGAPDAGSTIIGVDIPGIAFMLKPFSPEGEIITTVKWGVCPSETYTANWVKYRERGADPALGVNDPDSEIGYPTSYIGQFKFDVEKNEPSLPISWSITNLDGDKFPVYHDIPDVLGDSATCVNGIMEFEDPDDHEITRLFMTENGAAIVDIEGKQDVFGFTKSVVSSTADIDGEYIGFAYIGINMQVWPIHATSTDGGIVTVDKLSPDTMTVEIAGFTTLSDPKINNPADGFVLFTQGGNVDDFGCMFNAAVADSDKKVLFCVAQSNHYHYNAFLVSK